jgi:hypothetical protein
VARFQGREPFAVETSDQMGYCIPAFSPRQLGSIGKGVAVCYGQHFFGMNHLISRHGQRSTGLF